MSKQSLPVILIADNIRSLYNVGSLFRLADGLAIEAIYLCGMTGYPFVENDPRPAWVAKRADKEIRKTGLAGVDSIPFRYFENTVNATHELRASGYQIISLELASNSLDYRKASYQFPLAVVVGHETEGVNDLILNKSDLIVHLPIYGKGRSLNVSTATSAMLYHLNSLYRTP